MTIKVIRIILLSKKEGGQKYKSSIFYCIGKTGVNLWKGWEMQLEKYFGKYTIKEYLMAY